MRITKVWFENDRIYILTDDGRTLWQSLLYYRRLREATDRERNDYEIDNEGIHWEALDEDVSLESFDYENPEPQGISLLLLSHPELNSDALARLAGIDRGTMRQYINGTRKPTPETEKRIYSAIHEVASKLAMVAHP